MHTICEILNQEDLQFIKVNPSDFFRAGELAGKDSCERVGHKVDERLGSGGGDGELGK